MDTPHPTVAPAERHAHGATGLETHFRRPPAKRALWGGLAAGPVAVLLNLHIVVAGAPWACRGDVEWPLHVGSAATMALALLGAALSWHQWRLAGREWPGEGGTVVARSRFIGAVGTMLSAFAALVVAAQWLSLLFLQPCWGN